MNTVEPRNFKGSPGWDFVEQSNRREGHRWGL